MRKTNIVLTIVILNLFFLPGCKKEVRNEPPKVVSYQVKVIKDFNSYLKYTYNDEGFLSNVSGVDRDKSLTCDIIYDREKVYLEYNNKTADEWWYIVIEVDPETGYIQTIDDGMYVATFMYDSLRFRDNINRLVASYYHGGKYAGDSLCYQIVYDENGILESCMYKDEKREYTYYTDEEYESNISTIPTEAFWGRFDRIIAYLPYTFGPPQKYLVKTVRTSGIYYKNYSYEKDQHGRVHKIIKNGVATQYSYIDE